MNLSSLQQRYRIDDPARFQLSKHSPADTGGLHIDKKEAKRLLALSIDRLSDLQERLYAQDRWAVLAIFQAMDAAGKDSAIKHVMSGINPQGCQVHSFKSPSAEDLQHDFMWRASQRLPERGCIGIFNRSYYEDVLVVRVRKKLLGTQKLPAQLVSKGFWQGRFEDIANFERHLARNGTLILKFFLHVSKEEQRKRLLERLDTPSKNWKFSMGDLADREQWGDYMTAYEHMIRCTSISEAPWWVVPADKKWFTRIVVAEAMVGSLERLDLKFPALGADALRDIKQARKVLAAEE